VRDLVKYTCKIIQYIDIHIFRKQQRDAEKFLNEFFSKTYHIQKEISVDDSMGAVPLT
jgi:hypothetical protein